MYRNSSIAIRPQVAFIEILCSAAVEFQAGRYRKGNWSILTNPILAKA
jgi:hypothetical protein